MTALFLTTECTKNSNNGLSAPYSGHSFCDFCVSCGELITQRGGQYAG